MAKSHWIKDSSMICESLHAYKILHSMIKYYWLLNMFLHVKSTFFQIPMYYFIDGCDISATKAVIRLKIRLNQINIIIQHIFSLTAHKSK